MKTTIHFERRLRQRKLRREWCEHVVNEPAHQERQENGYYVFWGFIEEVGRYIRVVLLADGETYETAHFDRHFKKRLP